MLYILLYTTKKICIITGDNKRADVHSLLSSNRRKSLEQCIQVHLATVSVERLTRVTSESSHLGIREGNSCVTIVR